MRDATKAYSLTQAQKHSFTVKKKPSFLQWTDLQISENKQKSAYHLMDPAEPCL